MRAPKRVLAATMLSLEAFVVFFAGLVAKDVSHLATSTALAVHGGLALACLLVAGMLRRPWGYAGGWLLQVAVIATGYWVPLMYVLGALFAGLWVVALRVGTRVERERSE
jgi:hypothetical protein